MAVIDTARRLRKPIMKRKNRNGVVITHVKKCLAASQAGNASARKAIEIMMSYAETDTQLELWVCGETWTVLAPAPTTGDTHGQ